MNRWENIEAFVHVVETKGFSKAATKMHVSKSHISRQISQLEDRLGAQLLIRTTRNMALTEVGHAFYLRCVHILASLHEAEQAVVDLQEKPRGHLRVTVAGAYGEDFIAPAVTDFMLAHEEISVELNFTNRVVDLVTEGYDLAIRAGGPMKDSTLIARRISNRELITCGNPMYLALKGIPETPEDLGNHNCLIGTLDTWRFLKDNRNVDHKVYGTWRSNNGRALVHAACKGLGLVQLPSFYVHDKIRTGSLTLILDKFKPIDTAIWAIYPHNRHLSAKVRLFVDFIAEKYNK